MKSTDEPANAMAHSTGADGDTFEYRFHFREFVRVILGDQWLRVSPYFFWRAHYLYLRTAGKWGDGGSTQANDNAGY